MALPNGELQITPLNPQHAYPVDKRMQTDTLNTRNSISPYIRWRGMQVHVLETDTTYMLKGGVTNEFWTVLGEGSGGGGSTFVGQFESVNVLPTTGSAGDYAYVGEGDDFVQYNWDNIAGRWVSNTTNLSPDKFYTATVANGPAFEKVVHTKTLKDEVVTTSGAQVIYPDEMKNFIFTGSDVTLEGVGYADVGNEFSVENRTGTDLIISSTGIVANTKFTVATTILDGQKKAFKGNGTTWDEVPVISIAFSDTLNSFNAKKTVGDDGLTVITDVYDNETGENVTYKEYTQTPPTIDGIIFVSTGGKNYLRNVPTNYNIKMFGAKGNGVTDDTTAFQLALTTIESIGGGTIFIGRGTWPISNTLTNFNRISLEGAGPDATTIKSNITDNGNLIDAIRDISLRASFNARNITFEGAGTTDGYGIFLDWFSNTAIENCYFSDFGAGAIKMNGTSNVSLSELYIRACGDNPVYSSELIGAIHIDRDDDFNNTLNLVNIYVSNCNTISGVFIAAYSCRLVNVNIESCHTLLRIGEPFANYYNRFSMISIFGLYFENPRTTALHIEQGRNVLIDGLFVGGNIYTANTPITIINSDNIVFKCADVENADWNIDSLSQDITVNGFGLLPTGIGGVNDPLNSTELGYYKGSVGRTQNFLPNSNDFSLWIKSGSPTVTQQNNFIDGGISWEITKTTAAHSVYQNVTRSFVIGDKINASVYIIGRGQCRLMGRRSSDNVTVELVRGQNIEEKRWRRMNISYTVDQSYNRISFYVVPATYGTSSGTISIAKGQFEIGTLEPGPYAETGALNIENVSSASINGDLILNKNILGFSDGPPTTGKYNLGDKYLNNNPSTGISFWECTATGTPGTWEPSYRQAGNQYFNDSFIKARSVTGSYDLNTVDPNGYLIYAASGVLTNAPFSGYWMIEDKVYSGIHVQTAWLLSGTGIYTRRRYSGTWSAWDTIEINIPDASISNKGKVLLATDAEYQVGTNTSKALTPSSMHPSGTTANRPGGTKKTGYIYFDTTLGKSIVWDGSNWIDIDVTKVSNSGATLLVTDGANLSGTLNGGAITYSTISGGVGFPTANGQLRTFNGSTPQRTYSIFKDRDSSDLYVQTYNSSNVGLGWNKIGSTSYIDLTDTTDTTYTGKAFFSPRVSSFETGLTLENPALLNPLSTIVDSTGSAWSAYSIDPATKLIRITDAGGGSLAGATGLQFKKLTIMNESSSTFTLLHEDAGTTAANRFNFADGNNLVMPSNSWVSLVYVNGRYRKGL